MRSAVSRSLSRKTFPLRRHRNGQWFKSVWNPRFKKSEQFYFGTWADDPTGERALKDPQLGWLARKDAIKAGVDNLRVHPIAGEVGLGELMSRFLTHKRGKCTCGELSLTTLGDYLRELPLFVSFQKPLTPASGLKPEHFTAYMTHLVEHRKLGRMARKRVRAYVTAFLRYGAKNGWYAMPNTGADWVAPATDPDAMRQARVRAGIKDRSDRILTGKEIRRLLRRASPAFRAIILLGVNCGLGPADIGRLTWDMIDLPRRRLVFPRPKTGVQRVGFLWKRTVKALLRVRQLKHNRLALVKDGEFAHVFITRKGMPYYREREVHVTVTENGLTTRKLKRVDVANAISGTFGRMCRELHLFNVSHYRLRHTFKTIGKRAKDREALDLMMGHRRSATGDVYDHEFIGWRRIKRVAILVHQRLWPNARSRAETPSKKLEVGIAGEFGEAA